MKKILFLIPSLAGGGAEKVLVNMVNHLDCKKYDITVQCLFDVGINKQYLASHIHYKYVFKRIIRGNKHIFKFFSPRFLFKKFVKEDYDIVVSYFQSPTTRIVAGCPNPKTKLVQWVHNEFHDRKKITSCYRSDLECMELQMRYDANVYVANTVKEIYLETFPELRDNQENIVLYNVVESDEIRHHALEPVAEQEKFTHKRTLISVGRMVPQKSFDRLLRVARKLKNDGFDFGLILLGTGELEDKLKEQSRELKLEDTVSFLGYQTNPYKYVRNSDLFVCSSLHEGFCTAVTESLIVGTPVITTMCSGMEELLGKNYEYGIIVENDEDALYEGVRELLQDDEKLSAYSAKAVERGKQFITKQTVWEIEQFFDKILV